MLHGSALQRVPVEARQVQLLGPGRGVERAQYAPDPRDVRHAQPARIAGLEILPERPVAETAYHQRKRDAATGKRQAPLYVSLTRQGGAAPLPRPADPFSAAAIRADTRSAAATSAASGRRM